VRDVLAKTGVHPRQIGCVIVNCSLFNPTPSLSAMIMNHFKMSSNVINYNLGGMGCSGKEDLQPHKLSRCFGGCAMMLVFYTWHAACGNQQPPVVAALCSFPHLHNAAAVLVACVFPRTGFLTRAPHSLSPTAAADAVCSWHHRH
jgi:hypothetical protein